MSAHLRGAAEAYAQVLAVVDPEHAWRVRVGPDGPDAARSTPTPVAAHRAAGGVQLRWEHLHVLPTPGRPRFDFRRLVGRGPEALPAPGPDPGDAHVSRPRPSERAGVPHGKRCRPSYERATAEQCVEAVERAARRLGHPPTVSQYAELRRAHPGWPSESLIRLRCGSWMAALRAAGEAE